MTIGRNCYTFSGMGWFRRILHERDEDNSSACPVKNVEDIA